MRIMVLVIATFLPAFVSAQSLCKSGESVLFNAKMGRLKGDSFVRNGKTLSLCGDKDKNPLKTLTYRYGSSEKVELEFSAPKDGRFSFDVSRNSPRGVDYSIEFQRGQFKYELNACLGMTCDQYDTKLVVYQNAKQIAEITADLADKVDDFFGDIIEEDTPQKSPVFK